MLLSSENHSDSPVSPRMAGRLLIVEPQTLLRWSLAAYLRRWFDVLLADGEGGAEIILKEQPVDALIVAHELPDCAADRIEKRARSQKPEVMVVRTVVDPTSGVSTSGRTIRLEKPFPLAQVAHLLGVPDSNGR